MGQPSYFGAETHHSLRFCVECSLNAITQRDSCPIPRMDEFIESFGDSEIIATIDRENGYCQVEVDEEAREMTTFICHEGLFHFLRLKFG